MKKFCVFFLAINLFVNVKAQVSYQTGSAVHSIPIFGWEDNKSRLSTSISLDYNSGNGLKVGDVASNVGQGWNLMAGGVISRMQNGEPDDQKPYFTGSIETWEDTKKYPPGYLYANFNVRNGVSSSINQYPIFKAKNIVYKQFNDVAADKELDRFAFNFNGRAGIFILDKITNRGVLLEDSRIKIWFVKNENNAAQQIRTTIVAFYIQDENGSIYKFTKFSKTKILKTNFCNPEQTQQLTQPKFKNNRTYYESSFDDPQIVNPYVINEWYLEEIEDALTHRKITFTYINRNIDAKAGISITHYNNIGDESYSVVSHVKSKTATPDLSTITWPDGYQLVLNYGAPRVDMNGSFALSSIDIKYAGRFSSKYELTTSYFIRNRVGSPKTEFQKSNARLCLLSLKKILPDLKGDEPPYMFSYYMGSNIADDVIPAPFSHLKDIWGFYNGDNSKDFNYSSFPINTDISQLTNTQLKGLCFLRNGLTTPELNPKNGYAKNGLLKQIIYPAGGSIKYEYEQNNAVLVGQSVQSMVGGVHVSKTSVADGGYSNDCSNPLVTTYKFTLDDAYTQSSLWGVEMPKNEMIIQNYYSPADKYFYYKPIFDMGCKYRYQYPGIIARDQAIDLTGRQKFLQAASGVMSVVSAVSQAIDVINLCISATPGAILAVVLDVIGTLVNIVLTCFTDPSDTNTTLMYYNSDLNGSNALPSQFKRVETKEGTGGNGRTVMEFTSNTDYAVWEPTNPTYSMKQRYAPYAYGLLKKEIIYNANNQKVQETDNSYNFNNASIPYLPTYHLPGPEPDYPSCKFLIKKSVSKRSDKWTNPENHMFPQAYMNTSTDDVLIDVYHHSRGRVELSETKIKKYKTGSNEYLEQKQIFGYSSYTNGNLQVSEITTINSDGTQSLKKFKYSCDYIDYSLYPNPPAPPIPISTGYLKTLNDNNIINELVSTSNYEYDNGYFLLNEVVTEFTQLNNGNVRPLRTIEQRFKEPHPELKSYPDGFRQNAWTYPGPAFATIWNFDSKPAPYIAPDYNYKVTQQYYYDAAGNLKGLKDEGGRSVMYIYDYDDRYIAATVTNVDPANDICAYTSFETSSFGGFTFTGTATYSPTSRTSGKRSLIVNTSRILSSSLNPSKRYKFSFYGFGNFTVTNATLISSSFTNYNFCTYYEYVTNPGATSISLRGNDASVGNRIDEVRLYPVDARMKTVGFDPIIGKMFDCDENSRVISYEYDNNGRLRFIKDENNSVLKMYEYNFSRKPACPVSYSNLEIVEFFTRNNCGSGSIGSEVPYIIPAGTYTSTHSQEAVDVMVDNDLELNGQNYANSIGQCIPVFYNIAKSENFYKEDCPIGFTGSSVSYSVPANKYRSFVSQTDADLMAQEEIDANGQAYANTPGVTTCILNTTAVWEGTGCTECVNNKNRVQVRDFNPNSPTYGQTQWVQTNDPCSSNPVPFYARIESENYYFYSDPYYTVEQADYYIGLYADLACTVPFYTTDEVAINYNKTTTEVTPYGQNNQSYEYYIRPLSGTHRINLGNLITYDFFDNGLEQFTNYAGFSLLEGCHYTIRYSY